MNETLITVFGYYSEPFACNLSREQLNLNLIAWVQTWKLQRFLEIQNYKNNPQYYQFSSQTTIDSESKANLINQSESNENKSEAQGKEFEQNVNHSQYINSLEGQNHNLNAPKHQKVNAKISNFSIARIIGKERTQFINSHN
jgi:hypothetical protein